MVCNDLLENPFFVRWQGVRLPSRTVDQSEPMRSVVVDEHLVVLET